MKPIRAFAVLPKRTDMSDLIAQTSAGVLIPFFSSQADANEWKYRKFKECVDEYKVVFVELKEVKE